ncbi:hypothetical protein BASA81_008435 [Batrachochytrium salamandrivorans]|nr:hypothetical protein BASA81_008435 [Batrachochytrium salamandrivorans]
MGNAVSSTLEEAANPWAEFALGSATPSPAAPTPLAAQTVEIKLPVSVNFASFAPFTFDFACLTNEVVVAISATQQVFSIKFGRGQHTFSALPIQEQWLKESSFTTITFASFPNPTAQLVVEVDSQFTVLAKRCKLADNRVLELQDVYGIAGSEACVICLTETSDTALEPCRHMCVCLACSPTLNKCPICRATVTSCVQVVKRTL